MASRTVPLTRPVDLRSTLAPLRHGASDPTIRLGSREVWRASRTPDGPATLHLTEVPGGVQAEAWGPGAERALHDLPGLVGALDDPSGFDPEHPVVRRLHRAAPGLRIPRTGRVFEALLPAVLEQRVTAFEARRAYHQLVARWGEPAPGPSGLLLAPTPEVLADVAYYELHVIGVEKRRADVLRRVAAHATKLEPLVDLPLADAGARLRAIPGVGAWTVAEVSLVAFGDADAVSVGDHNLKHQVAFALAGEEQGTDARMLELLEPFAGHRGRVCRLIVGAGISPPRRSPRHSPQPIAER